MERIIRRVPTENPGAYCSFVGLGMDQPDDHFSSRLYDSMEMLFFEGITHFICDATTPAGLLAAWDAMSLRRMYPEITVELAYPSDPRASIRSVKEMDLLYQADVVTFISYRGDANASRRLSTYMISQGSILLAESEMASGAVAASVEQARAAGRRVTSIPGKIARFRMLA